MKPIMQMVAAGIAALMMVSCAHRVKPVEYPLTTSPAEIMETMAGDLEMGYATQVDVLAREDFNEAKSLFNRAERQMSEQVSQARVLGTLGKARAYLTRANELADGRRAQVLGILNARAAALEAGIRDYPRLGEALNDADWGLSEAAKGRTLEPGRFAELQQQFLNLETQAIQANHLEVARNKIEGAKQKKAERRAPESLKKAELALMSAENMIVANRHDENAFLSSVVQANYRADLLVDVMNKVVANGKVIPENVALRMVILERRTAGLERRLKSTRASDEQKAEMLSMQEQELKQARETISIDRALAKANNQFSKNEADVYRDGDKLLIRLKSIQFKSGSADLPPLSLALLGKVRSITNELNPLQIVIEGHTDSTGSTRLNNMLSQKRAEAVAEYLVAAGVDRNKIQAIGYGASRPIADNRSKEGRAANRRVDVVITPTAVDTATTSM